MNFSHACQNFLTQVVFYEAVQLYERYGLSPELNKPSVKKHFKDFGFLWDHAVKKRKNKSEHDVVARDTLKYYLTKYESVDAFLQPLSSINKVYKCNDMIRYLIIMFNACVFHCKDEPIEMKGGTYYGCSTNSIVFVREDEQRNMTRISDLLPKANLESCPNMTSLLQFAGTMLLCPNTDNLTPSDHDEVEFFTNTVCNSHWMINLEDSSDLDEEEDDAEVQVALTSPETIVPQDIKGVFAPVTKDQRSKEVDNSDTKDSGVATGQCHRCPT